MDFEPSLARLRPTASRRRLDLLLTPGPTGGNVVVDLTVVTRVFAVVALLREVAPGAAAASALSATPVGTGGTGKRHPQGQKGRGLAT